MQGHYRVETYRCGSLGLGSDMTIVGSDTTIAVVRACKHSVFEAGRFGGCPSLTDLTDY